MKNRSVVPKQEEKYFIFTELKNKLSYTQNEYWIKETQSRLKIILEKFNNFMTENTEDNHNDLFIESFKSLILNQLRHLSKEMNFISLSKGNISETFQFAKENFFVKENPEFSQIIEVIFYIFKYLMDYLDIKSIIVENFNHPTDNKENLIVMMMVILISVFFLNIIL